MKNEQLSPSEIEKKAAALAAVEFVKNGDLVGLGTGSTAKYAIEAIGQKVKSGLNIKTVATSIKTAQLAASFGIEVMDLSKVGYLDISIDGADEFTKNLDLIKGGGGALFREKIVASLTKNSIIIADSSKLVAALGAFTLPIEIVPLAYQYAFEEIEKLGGKCVLRKADGEIYKTDNGNVILDTDFGLIKKPENLSMRLNQIVGVFAQGLFIGLTQKIIMAKENSVEVFEK
ncbi:ribose 5-phosphate isomerase A [Pedobacter sp. UYP30]|uniref:ribose-5-phosphate isomerase RpiA n=1 Tax=Pedobacter sp. UYP30 TaxID=1756400 RepID=UPI00339A3458